MNTQQTALVLGAAGSLGREVADRLLTTGWKVRAMSRHVTDSHTDAEGLCWLPGDAMNAADVKACAEGCSVIIHAVNPPGYRDWEKLVIPMIDNTIAAARAVGATILVPGNVYNFGPDALPLVAEDAPQQPITRKGAVRIGMEQHLRDYAEQGGQVLIARAGDFFGPRAANSWLSQGMIKPGKPITRITNPGHPGIGHQWSYLPDLAQTMVQLLTHREQLDTFACLHVGGHWDADGTEMARAIQRVVTRHGGNTPKIKAFPWWLIRSISPFHRTLREVMEMRYLWQQSLKLNNQRLKTLLGEEPHTPLDRAVEETLKGLGCID